MLDIGQYMDNNETSSFCINIGITLEIFNMAGKIKVSIIWLIINVKELMITDLMDL